MNPEDRSTPEEDGPIDGGDPSASENSAQKDNQTQPRDLTEANEPVHPDEPSNRDGSENATDGRGPAADTEDGTDASRSELEVEPGDVPPGMDGDERGILYRFRHDMEGPFMWVREVSSSVAIVLLIGLLLFAVSGAWPPMVAVESGSMEPNMEVGDLVFVTDPGRFAPDAANNEIGVVTHEVGQDVDYRSFNDYGSVIIYQPPGRQSSPIIHRAMFHVEEGENWYDRANERFHNADSCQDLRHCPAPRDGFITLGDNNRVYDQANGIAEPVPPEWVTGVARARVPYLGYVRLITTGQAELSDILATTGIGPAPTRGSDPSWAVGSGGSSWPASAAPSAEWDPSMSALTPIRASTSPSQLSNRA